MPKRIAGALVCALLFVTGAGAAEAGGLEHECTSWFVFADLTGNGTNLLHKNRDAKPRDLMPLASRADSPRKWIGLGNRAPDDPGDISVCMGMNSSGLAAVVNSGEVTVEPPLGPEGKMGTPKIIETCLAECDTASQAVEKLRGILRARRYYHGRKGSIFLFMDTREAYIAEVTAKRCSAVRFDHGYAVRANIWHNPDMAGVSDDTIGHWLNSRNREYMVIRSLNNTLRAQKRIAVKDMLAISRTSAVPEGSRAPGTVCSKSTNSASTLEIDREYPDVLSTGFFLIGPPRHTLCVPIPVCTEAYSPAMTGMHWSEAAWRSFDAKGFDAEIPPEWQKFEADSLRSYRAAQAKARKLLASGRRDDAVKLLNGAAISIWDAAEKLLEID